MNSRALLDKLAVFKTNKKLQLGVGGALVVGVALFAGFKLGASKATAQAHAQPGHGTEVAAHGKHDAHAKAKAHDQGDAHEEHAKNEDSHKNSHEDSEGTHERAPAAEHDKHAEHGEAKEHNEISTSLTSWETYRQAWERIQGRAEVLKRADEENEKLRLENANLRLRLETMHFDCQADEALHRSREIGLKLEKDAGSRLARTLATIQYKAPPNLTPQQLYTLAVSYFKAHEDEKAAVILSILTNLQDDQTYKTPQTLLMTGVAWYRIDNLKEADTYFDKAMKTAESPGEEKFERLHAQLRVWKGVVAERLGEHTRSQEFLREVLNVDPHSAEAAWVNAKEARRATASAAD